MVAHDPPGHAPGDSAIAGPSGTPLGRAFLIRPTPFNEDLIAAVRACASVHGDGPLPSIPILLVSTPEQPRGRFWFDLEGPSTISINMEHRHRIFAVVHEIGHFLDYSGIGTPNRFASESDDALEQWRVSALQSRQVRQLRHSVETISDQVTSDLAAAYVSFLDLPEIWARCYAQYVTLRSQDVALLAGLATHRTLDVVGAEPASFERLLHWDDNDFAPIAAAIEHLFRSLGWRSER